MKQIEGYGGRYSITKDGRVYSHLSRKFLKPAFNKPGYLFVILYYNGQKKNHQIHQLVAEYFLTKPSENCVVDHIDRDRTNNHVSNLRWVVRGKNIHNSKLYDNSKNIREHYGAYEVYMMIKGERRTKTVKTLDEAIRLRDEWRKEGSYD